jgi:sirohydrochlorin cobaltochelatase
MSGSAIILFAHGARDPQWARPFQRIQALVAQTLPQVHVALAFLERMTPDLPSAAADAIAAGAQSVTVVPLFLGSGGHVKEDVAALVRELEQRYLQVRFRLTTPIGEDEELVAAIAGWVVRQQG